MRRKDGNDKHARHDKRQEEKGMPKRYNDGRSEINDTAAVARTMHLGVNITAFGWEIQLFEHHPTFPLFT